MNCAADFGRAKWHKICASVRVFSQTHKLIISTTGKTYLFNKVGSASSRRSRRTLESLSECNADGVSKPRCCIHTAKGGEDRTAGQSTACPLVPIRRSSGHA